MIQKIIINVSNKKVLFFCKWSDYVADDKIEGRNPVIELLSGERDIDKILVQKGEKNGSINKIIHLAKDRNIVIQEVIKSKLDEVSETGAHQGVIAYAAAYNYVSIDNILNEAKEKSEDPFIVILDSINDPHNMGSIIRTANAAGVHGVIIPKRRSVGLNATVAKTSAGAVEHTKIARVTNLTRTIKELQEKGVWIVGLDISGEESVFKANLKGPIGLVIGSEGQGMSRLVKESCDFIYNIPMLGKIQSLNASVAAGIVLYEVVKHRLL
jgi:23S rRNA (guanosine2251-2'-O)-methyltransferase